MRGHPVLPLDEYEPRIIQFLSLSLTVCAKLLAQCDESARPQTASFDPLPRSRLYAILGVTMELTSVDFQSYEKSATEALDELDAHEQIGAKSGVLIKPNLINDSPPPITTSAACCEAIVN